MKNEQQHRDEKKLITYWSGTQTGVTWFTRPAP
jgi:hypothetical protein